MKKTMYELLGMVKDGKAPKKIKYDDIIFEYDGIYYMTEHNTYLDEYCDLSRVLNDKVEILEEEKKIPKKLDGFRFKKETDDLTDEECELENYLSDVNDKINEIIDYLESKGEYND